MTPAHPRPWHWLVAAAGMFLLLLLRAPDILLVPVFSVDDGTLFADAWNEGSQAVLLRANAGNVALLSNLAAAMLVPLLPPGWLPLAFNLFALGFAALAIGAFATPRFAPLLPDIRWRVAVCVLIALLPVHSYNLLGTLMFQNWNALLLLALLTATRFAAGWTGWLVELPARMLLAWSHPLALALLPVHAGLGLLALRRRDGRGAGLHAAMVLALLAYWAVGVGGGQIERVQPIDLPLSVWLWLDKVVLELLVGVKGLIALRESGWIWPARLLLAAGVTMVTGMVLAVLGIEMKGPDRRPVPDRPGALALFVWCMIAFTMAVIATRKEFALTERIDVSYRYVYVQKALLVVAGAMVLDMMLAWHSGRKAQARTVLVAGLALALALSLVNHGQYRSAFQGVAYPRWAASRPDAPPPGHRALMRWEQERQRAFLAAVAQAEADAAPRTLSLERGGATITVRTGRRPAGPEG